MLTFIKPIKTCNDLLLIIYDSMIIGSIKFNTDVITDINISSVYFSNVKDNLINRLLLELGWDSVELLVDKGIVAYYKDMGFIQKYTTQDDMILLGYEV